MDCEKPAVGQPILDPSYWKTRLDEALSGPHLHYAVFRCQLDRWVRITESHRKILSGTIRPTDAILDAGCGWGRLLDLMPIGWRGFYAGIDISPDFIRLARQKHPRYKYNFCVADLCSLPCIPDRQYDWAIAISIRPMVKRNLGNEAWETMERELRRVANRLLFLEYDETDPGSIE